MDNIDYLDVDEGGTMKRELLFLVKFNKWFKRYKICQKNSIFLQTMLNKQLQVHIYIYGIIYRSKIYDYSTW